MTPPDRFAQLRAYARDMGHSGLSLEFCEEMVRLTGPESRAIDYPPIAVVREFRVFMDGMRELLGPPR